MPEHIFRTTLDNESLINIFKVDLQINHAPNTVLLYLDALNRFIVSISGKKIIEASKQDFIKFFRTHIDTGYSQSYINLHSSAFRSFYRTMYKYRIITQDRSNDLLKHRSLYGKKLPRFLSQCEITKVIELGPDTNTFKGIRDRAILELLYSSGIRAQELISIYIGDLNICNSTLRVIGKGNIQRIVPVGNKAIEALKAYITTRNKIKVGKTDVLFLTVKGRPILSRKCIWDVVNHNCVKTIGRSGYTHLIRHTCATHELQDGMDIRFIQEQLGHQSISTTAKYVHVNLKYLQEQHSKLFSR